MLVQLRHQESGKIYVIPASQVVVFNDDGDPVDITYERDRLILCTDAGQSDFVNTIAALKISKLDTKRG
jgi:hypothetical protein